MRKEETVFQAWVLKRLRRIPNSWWSRIVQMNIRGTPDIIGCVNGKFVALEVKKEGGKATPLQSHTLDEIRSAGGCAFILSPESFENVWSVITEL